MSENKCQHPQLWFYSGDYYVRCATCHATWGRLKFGQQEYGMVNGQPVGCSPEAANHGFVNDGCRARAERSLRLADYPG